MDIFSLSRLGLKHAKNHMAEEVYIRTGQDWTKPITFYGLANEQCNAKCRYCESWRLKQYKTEMTIEEWQRALLSVRDFVGEYSINFSGGEPLIKPGFIDLMVWCRRNNIRCGVTTNGSPLTRRNAEKIVEAEPFNVNISVDAPDAEIHDYLRGYPGLFEKLSNGIRYILEEQEKSGCHFPIIIKPTVNANNFRYLPDLVNWVKSIGATCINLQPMYRLSDETYNELWIEEENYPELQKVVDNLLVMKSKGEPILNSKMIINLLVAHFREEKAPLEVMPCRVGMRNVFIQADGDINVCTSFPPIGNIKEQSMREIWHGTRAQEIRKQTVACDKLCLHTCLSQKTLANKIKMGMALIINRKHWSPGLMNVTD